MRIETLTDLGRYDALYVSPELGGALLSCVARMASERAQGLRVLVVAMFNPGDPGPGEEDEFPGGTTRALEGWGVDYVAGELPPAARRQADEGPAPLPATGLSAEDRACLDEIAERLDLIRARVLPRQVYLPLGVGSDVDQRLCHEAGLRIFQERPGLNAFFYEERPQVLVPGAIRIRLGELGARLPPAATDIRDRAGLARFLFRLHMAPHVRARLRSVSECARHARTAATAWRRARAWRPQRSFGLRLQPVVHVVDARGRAAINETCASCEPEIRRLFGSPARLLALGREYARRLGSPPAEHLERYWLLLPSLEGEEPAAAVAAPTRAS